MNAALLAGCGAEQGSEVVRLPEPVALRTAEPSAASTEPGADGPALPSASEKRARLKPAAIESDLDEGKEASERERAKELFQQGLAAYEQGDFQKACAAFEVAYQLVPEQPLLFNIASCEMRLGHVPKACDLFRKYVANGSPGDPRIVEVSRQVAQRCP
jgi:tetratricopeptide (TPR) repeat protein